MAIDKTLLENKRNDRANNLYILTKPLDRENKIVIDIKDIIDFCFCPHYYYIKHNNEEEINLKELYDKSLHNTFYSYLRLLQEDKLKTALEFLKYKWGKEWITYKNTKELLVTPSSHHRDSYEIKRKQGIDAIFTFNDLMMKDKQFPIIIGHKYEIEILPNIILTGTLEYVRELTIKDKKIIQIVQFVSETNRFKTNLSTEHNIELIAMSYAFKMLFNVQDFQILSIDIVSKKYSYVSFNNKDYNLLKKTIEDTIICIQNNINCISPDKHCYHCEYRNVCINTI